MLNLFILKNGIIPKYKRIEALLPRTYPIILFLLTFVISGYFSLIGVDPHHDGIMFKPAMDVASGQMLFRDTFSQYGALTTLLQAASLIIFGEYLITIKLLTVFFYGLISILLYLIFAKVISKTLVFITLIVWIFMAPYYVLTFLPWSSVHSLFFQLLGAYFLTISLTKNSKKFLMLSGIATSLTFWCRQPVGLFMFLAVFVFFVYLYFLKQLTLNQLKKNLIIFISGNFIVSLLFVLWLLANQAIKDWWLQSIAYAFLFNQSFDGGFSFHRIIASLFPISINPNLIWILLPLSTIFLLTTHSIKLLYKSKDIQYSKTILLLCFIGLASWLQYYPVTCIRHLYWASTPMFCLFTFYTFQFLDKFIVDNAKIHTTIIKLATIILILFAFSPELIIRAKSGYEALQQSYYNIDQPQILKYMRLTKPELENYTYIYSEIDSFLKNNPQGNVVNLTGDALYNTFNPQIRNVHQFYVNWGIPNPIYPDYYQKTFSYISENQPLILTIDPSLIPKNYFQIDKTNKSSNILFYRTWPKGQVKSVFINDDDWQGGFSGLEGTKENNWRWCSDQGTLIINNFSNEDKKVIINATFLTGYPELSNLKIESALVTENLKISNSGYNYKRDVQIPPGRHVIKFSCDAKRIDAPKDPRYIVFGIWDFQMLESE